MKRFFAVCILTSVCSTVFAEDPTAIELGGPRKATAIITEAVDAYKIEVCLIPVRCFDSGMNRRLSQEKARSYAVEALIRHLGGGKRQSATMSNVEIIEARNAETRFVLVMRVPRKSVRLTEVTEGKAAAKPLEGNAPRSLLEAKDDYQETLEVVMKTLTDDIPMFTGKLPEFYTAVSDAEELGITRLKSLRKEIKVDRWLLAIECEELLRAIDDEEERFLGRLRKWLEEVESKAKGDE